MFSEIYANKLPPHRPYDCEIKILPNTVLYYCPIYPLTEKESTALKEYIDEMLAKGFIRKSKSPAGHFGFKKTFSLINRYFWWSSMHKDIKEYIKSCEIC